MHAHQELIMSNSYIFKQFVVPQLTGTIKVSQIPSEFIVLLKLELELAIFQNYNFGNNQNN